MDPHSSLGRLGMGDEWEAILEGINFGDISEIDGLELPPFVCNMGMSSRNKKKPHGNYNMTYSDEGPSLTIRKPLTQEEMTHEALEKDIYERILLKLDEEIEIDEEEAAEEVIREEKDSDDEEEYNVKRDKNGKPLYGPSFAKYLNCNDPMDRALALQETLNPFRKIYVRIVVPYGNAYDQGYQIKATNRELSKFYKLSDIMSPDPQEKIISKPGTSNRAAKSKYNTNLARLLPKQIYSLVIVDWEVLNNMGCAEEIEEMLEIKVDEMGVKEEIFTSKTITDEELMSRKVIKFRLGGCSHRLTILEFACCLGLYSSDEIQDDGFETYFLKGLRNDDHSMLTSIGQIEVRMIGYDKVQRNELWLMSMFEAKNQNGYENLAWLIARWLKRKGVGSQRESVICYRRFITKIAKRVNLLTDEVLNGLSAPIYCRSLDTTTLRKLINSNKRLIVKEPVPGDSRVVIPRPSRHSISDLYDRIGRMEI
ncbi:hypothetical protein Tco_1123659 [Tanacetum coccineum]|uniref:Uncharacterized protein n=1 Tax=Tanacetum coccineum TaxID=301880 RepID=A0ABQ5J7S1_9ASTR